MFWQCKDEEEDVVEGVPDEISISADRTTIDLPSEANSFELTITASGTDWDVSEEISWLEAMKVDDTKLRVSYQQNTGEARTGKITASIESESLEITVNQSAGPYVVLGATEYMLPPGAAMNHEITLDLSFFRSSSQWYAEKPNATDAATSWLSVVSPSSASKSALESKVLTLNIEENIAPSNRSLSLSLQVEDASNEEVFSSALTMTQSQAVIVLDRTMSIGDASGVRTVTVTTTNGEDWSIKGHQDITDADNPKDTPGWLTPVKDNGLKLTYEKNTGRERTARVILEAGTGNEVFIEITQDKGPVVITVQHYIKKTGSVLSNNDNLPAILIAGRKDTLLVDTNNGTSWTATLPSWASKEERSGGTNLDTLIVTYPSNPDALRSGTLTITSATKTLNLMVRQFALTFIPYVDGSAGSATASMTLTLPEVQFLANKDTVLVDTGAPSSWEVSESLDWITTRKILSDKTGTEDTLEISYLKNTEADTRSADISISAGSVTKTIEVSQGQKALVVNTDAYTLPFSEDAAATVSLDVNFLGAANKWYVDETGAEAWLALVSPTSTAKEDDLSVKNVVFNIKENVTDKDRQTTVTLKVVNASDTELASEVITITQSKAAVVLNTAAYTLPFSENATATVTLDVDFLGTSNQWYIDATGAPNWLELVSPTSSDKEDDLQVKNVVFTIEENSTNEDRKTTVMLKVEDASDTELASRVITITQSKATVVLKKTAYTLPYPLNATATVTLDVDFLGTSNQWYIDVTGAPNWLKLVSPTSSDKEDDLSVKDVVFNITENKTNMDRPATVTLKVEDASDTELASLDITITQSKAAVVLTTTEYTLPYHANATATVTLDADLASPAHEWYIDPGSEPAWLTLVSPTSTDKEGDLNVKDVVFNIKENVTNMDRKATVTLKVEDVSDTELASIDITITQSKAAVVLNTDTYTLPYPLNATATVTLDVDFYLTSNKWYIDATGVDSWLELVSPTSAAKQTNLQSKDVVFKIKENATNMGRSTKVTLKVVDASDTELGSRVITITQSTANVVLTTTAYTLSYPANATATVTLDVDFLGTSNKWYIDPGSEPAWLTLVSPTSTTKQTNLQTKTVTFNIKENVTNIDRKSTVTLKVEDGSDAELASIDITITQSKAAVVLNTDAYTLPYQANATATVTLDVDFYLTSDKWYIDATGVGAWLELVSPKSTAKQTDLKAKTVTFNIKENATNMDRPATVTLKVEDGSGTELGSRVITITQAKAAVVLTTATYTLPSLANPTATVTLDVDLASPAHEWYIDAGSAPAWLKLVSPKSSAKQADLQAKDVVFNIKENETNMDRPATVTLKVEDSSDKELASLDITITQSKAAVVLNKDAYTLPYQLNATATVTLDVDFYLTSNKWYIDATGTEAWLKLVSPTSTDKEDDLSVKDVVFNITENKTNMDRPATVTLKVVDASDKELGSRVITITQAKAAVVLTTATYTLPSLANPTATVTLDIDLASPADEWYIDPGNEPAWLTLVSPTSSTKENDLNVKDVVFNIKENETNMDRPATVTLKVEDSSDKELASLDITITQSKAAVVLNKDAYTLPYQPNTSATVTLDVDFYLTSNKWYIDATGTEAWLALTSPTSAAKQTDLQAKNVVFNIKENATNKDRKTTVTLKVVDDSDTELGSRVITITQSTAAVVLNTDAYEVSYLANPTATVTLDVDFLGTSNKWYIDPGSEPAWLTLVSPTSTTKQTNLQTKTVTFNIKENVTNIDRKATVTLKVEDASDAELASRDITITQSKAAVVLNTDAYTLPYLANATATVTLDVDFYLTSDKWYIDATGVGAWLELVSPKSSAKQTDLKAKTVTFNIKENATNMDRPATVTLKVEDGSGTELGSRVITITQSKAAVVLTTATYTLPSLANPTATVTLDADLASPAHEWYIDAGSAPAWLKLVSPKSSAKQADLQAKTVTFNITENVLATDRPATVTLKVEDSSDKELASLDITITQSKATIVVERLIEITAASGVKTVPVTTTNGNAWTVSSYQDITDSENPTNNPSWITPSNDSGLKLEYQGNTSTPRIASIVLASGSAEVTVQVNQARGPVVITLQHYAKKTASALISGNYLPNNISIAGGKDTLLVDTGNGEAWTATLSAAWASKQEIDGGANVDTLIVTYSPNSDDMSRESTIVINSGTKSFTVKFRQLDLGISLLDLSAVPTPLLLEALEGKDTVLVSTGGEAWEVSESLDWITPKKILSGKTNEEDTLEISYVENATNMAKEGEISISVGSVTKTIEVKQKRPPYVVLNTDTYTIASEGGDITVTLDIEFNADQVADEFKLWYLDDNTKPAWVTSVIGPLFDDIYTITADPPNKDIELSVEANNTNMERSGKIKLEIFDLFGKDDAPPIEEHLITIIQSKATVVLKKDAYTLPYQANATATVTLDVDFLGASNKWYIDPGSEPAAWLTLVSPTSTDKEDDLSVKNVVFNIKENATDMDRPATVTLKVEDSSDTELASKVITITQSKAAVVLKKAAYTLPYQANATATVTLDVALASPAHEWYIDAGSAPAWLKLVSPKSSAKQADLQAKTVTFNIKENVTNMDRPATVTLKVEDVSDTELASLDITITQSKATIVVERLIEITAASGVKTVPVTTTSSDAWTVSSYQDITDSENPTDSPSWITPSKDSGLKLEYEGNTSTPRVASIVLASGSAEVTVQVNQAKGPVVITLQHYVKKTASALSNNDNLPDIPLAGRKDTLLVDTGNGTAWTAAIPAWASKQKIDGGANADTLIVSYSSVANNSRQGTITITSDMKTFTLNVEQKPPPYAVLNRDTYTIASDGSVVTVTLDVDFKADASKVWVISKSGAPAWVTSVIAPVFPARLTRTSGRSLTASDKSIRFRVAENNTPMERSGKIKLEIHKLKSNGFGGFLSDKLEENLITITQSTNAVVLTTTAYTLPYQANATATVPLDVTFTAPAHEWYIDPGMTPSAWLTLVSPTSADKEDDLQVKNVVFNITENETDMDRAATVTLKVVDDSNNNLGSRVMTITQSKAAVVLNTDAYTLPYQANATATVTLDVALASPAHEWYIDPGKTPTAWLTLVSPTSADKEDDLSVKNVVFNIKKNVTGTDRPATVTLKVEDVSDTELASIDITITQSTANVVLNKDAYKVSYLANPSATVTLDVDFIGASNKWYIDPGSEPAWLKLVSPKSSAKQADLNVKTVTFNIKENLLGTDRPATVTLKVEDDSDTELASKVITITQSKATIVVARLIEITAEESAASGVKTVPVTTTNSAAWTVSSYQDITDSENPTNSPSWITPSNEGGDLKLEYQDNTGSPPRVASIVLASGSAEVTVQVNQARGFAPGPIKVQHYVSGLALPALEPGANLPTVPVIGRKDVLLIDTKDIPWTAEVPSWVTQQTVDGGANADRLILTYTDPSNPADVEITGAITITANTESFTFNVKKFVLHLAQYRHGIAGPKTSTTLTLPVKDEPGDITDTVLVYTGDYKEKWVGDNDVRWIRKRISPDIEERQRVFRDVMRRIISSKKGAPDTLEIEYIYPNKDGQTDPGELKVSIDPKEDGFNEIRAGVAAGSSKVVINIMASIKKMKAPVLTVPAEGITFRPEEATYLKFPMVGNITGSSKSVWYLALPEGVTALPEWIKFTGFVGETGVTRNNGIYPSIFSKSPLAKEELDISFKENEGAARSFTFDVKSENSHGHLLGTASLKITQAAVADNFVFPISVNGEKKPKPLYLSTKKGAKVTINIQSWNPGDWTHARVGGTDFVTLKRLPNNKLQIVTKSKNSTGKCRVTSVEIKVAGGTIDNKGLVKVNVGQDGHDSNNNKKCKSKDFKNL